MQDDGRLPAYSLGLAEEQQPGDKRGRRGDHADEDPALKPVDLFIGVKGLGCCKERGPDPRGNGMLPVCLPHSLVAMLAPFLGPPPFWPPAGGLPPHADEMGVFDAVVSAGEVVGVKLIRRKRDRGDCRGYGEAHRLACTVLTLALPWPCDPACTAGLLPRLLMLRSKGWPWSSVPLSLGCRVPAFITAAQLASISTGGVGPSAITCSARRVALQALCAWRIKKQHRPSVRE